MSAAGQPLSPDATPDSAPLPAARDASSPVESPQRKYGGEPSRRRVWRLIEEIFGPSQANQIQGLLKIRRGAPGAGPEKTSEEKETEKELNFKALREKTARIEAELEEYRTGKRKPESQAVALREAYQRGRRDLENEIVFAQRLAAIRARYENFDAAWNRVRPLVPRAVLMEAADLEDGLEACYHLARLPELCSELAELPPGKAQERFRHFVRDLRALKGA
jgi:hypothetical protein